MTNQRLTTRSARRTTPWLMALALVLAATAALTHEIEHDLDRHDDALCALHALANLGGKALPTVATMAMAVSSPTAFLTHADVQPVFSNTTSFHARAPPVSVV